MDIPESATFEPSSSAERALRESEDRYRDLVENSLVLIGTHDAKGRILSLNRAAANLLEIPNAEDLAGRSLTEYVPPDLMPQFDQYLETILRDGHAEGLMVIATPSGKTRIVGYRNTLRRQDKIEPIVRWTGQEVTEKIQAEKAQAFLASLVESSQDAIIGKTLEGIIVSWNHGAEELYGYRAQEVVGKSISILAPPDRAAELAPLLEKVRGGEQISVHETVRVRKDGRLVDVSLTISPVRDATGEITGVVTIARDITERKRAEDRTRLQTAALESAANGIIIADRAGRIIWVNPAFTRLSGYTAAEVIGQNPRVLKSGAHDAVFYQKLWNTVLSGEVWQGEILNRRKDGALYTEEMTITPVRDDSGIITHFIAIKRDITERKRVGEALRDNAEKHRVLYESSRDAIMMLAPPKWEFTAGNPAAIALFGASDEQEFVAAAPWMLSPEYQPDGELSSVKAPRMIAAAMERGSQFFEWTHKKFSGEEFFATVTLTRMVYRGQPLLQATVSDITERKRAEATMAERHRLATLVAEVGVALTGAENTRQGLQRCAEILVRNIDAAFARVWTVNEDEKVLELQASAGMYTHIDGGHARVPIGKFKIGRIAESGEPHLTNSVQNDSWVGDPEWARREGMVAFAGYPLKVEERVLGVAAAFARKPLTEATLQAFASVADNIAQFIERKRAEDALRDSEERYRTLFERNLAGVFRGTLPSRKLIDCNDAYARILGYESRQEVLDYGKLHAFYDAAEYKSAEARLLNERVLTNYQIRFCRKDQTPVWVLANVSLVMREDGEDLLIEGTLIDITARKRAEDELQQSRQMLQSILDTIPQRVFWKDRNLTYLGCNRTLALDAGVQDPSEIIGKTDFDLSWAKTAEIYRADDKLVVDQGSAKLNFEEILSRPDGSLMWLRTSKLPLRDHEGRVIGVIGTYEDITEHKQAEEELRESNEMVRLLLDSIPEAVYGIDMQGNCTFCNPSCLRLLGYPEAADLHGKNMHDLTHHTRQDGTPNPVEECHIYEAFRRGQGTHIDDEVLWRRDGSSFPAEYWSRPMHRYAEVIGTVVTFVDVTERKQAERALEERTVYLNTLFEISPMGIVVLDTEGCIQMSNSAFERVFLYSHQEIMGVNLDNFIVPEGLSAEAKSMNSLCLSGSGAQATSRRRRKDGTMVDVDIYGVPLVIEGKLQGLLGLYHDITERRRAEESLVKYAEDLEISQAAQQAHAEQLARLVQELAQERELLRALMDNVPNYIYFKDLQSRIIRTNIAHAKAFGLSDPAQAVGKTDSDFFTAEHAQQAYNDEQEVIHTGKPLMAQEEKETWPNGRETWVSTTKMPLRDANGAIIGTFGVSHDITEGKLAEIALRASEERYRELFENASDIVYTTGMDTRLTSLNRVGQKTLGYSAEEATQLTLEQLVSPKHWEQINRSRERLMAGASDITMEVEVTTKDGRQMMLEVKPRLIYRGGKPVGVQGIGRDITGRDAAEVELRHAQKLESVGRLASGIAHEINTPIQFVGDNTRFLQDSFGDLQTLLAKYQELRDAANSGPVRPELLAEVHHVEETADCAYLLEEIPKALTQTLDGVTRVATIVRAMKEFAHPEGKEMAAADLNRALLSTLTVARNELKYVADVDTEFGDLPLVVCNIGDLNQVFLNLLVNAAHAIGESVKGTGQKGKIRVCTAPEGDAVLVTISDTGCGIPEANRSKVFDPFFTTKEVGRGTGQGLAIARSVVVERHKGSLTFESEVGKGTTFMIRLPVDPGESSKETKVP